MLVTGALLLHASPLSAQPTTAVAADFRFDLGPVPRAAGHTLVSAATTYTPDLGHGFDFGCRPIDDANGIVTGTSPLFFSVKVPEGNYRVTVTLGGAGTESQTTVRTESGHLMLADVKTMAGQTVTHEFIANVRRPTLPPPPRNAPGDARVNMFLPGEAEAWHWDEKLTIEFNGTKPCVSAITIKKDDAVPTIFIAGDSTVGDPRRGPGGNWPTQLCQYFKPTVAVCNSAEGGETSKSFITGARFDKVLSQMKPGDFFLVQFGHNDSKKNWPQSYTEPATSFKAYLKVYIEETRRRDGTIVFVTPMERRDNGDSVGPWARAMREVAAVEKVPVIDGWAMSKELWTAMGPSVGTAFSDVTHLSSYGGYLLSKNIVKGIRGNVPELAKHLVDDIKELDLSNIDPRPAYLSQPSGPGGPSGRGPGSLPATVPAGGAGQ